MAQQTAQQPQAAAAMPFKLSTRRYYASPGNMQALTAAGAVSQIPLLKTGYLARVNLNVSGTIQLNNANASATNVSPAYAWPWNLLSNIRLAVNPTDVYNLDGFGAYLAQLQNHIGYVGGGGQVQLASNFVTAAQGPASIFGTAMGVLSVPASSNLQVQVLQRYSIPVAVDSQLKTGMLDMQALGLNATLYTTLGQVVDWFGTFPTGITLGPINISISPYMEMYAKPQNASSQPDTSYWHTWRYDDYPWSAAGDQIYSPPVPGNVFLRVLGRLLESGYDGTPAPLTPANFGLTYIDYTGLAQPEVLPMIDRLACFRELHGFDLPDGVIPFDFRDGGGSVELGWDPRDNYNTSKMTYFHTKINTTIAPPAGSIIRWYREELVPVRKIG